MRRILPVTALLALLAAASQVQAAGLVMRDDFSRATSGWADNSRNAHRAKGFSTYTPSGKFQMTPTEDGTFGVVVAPRQAASQDVRIEADDFMYAGLGRGGSGIVCRLQDGNNFYAFLVSGAPGWTIVKVQNGKPTILAGGPLPKGVMPGSVEGRLQATCEGDRLGFGFGGRAVGQARDGTFRAGKAGLMVLGEAAAGTSATFDNFALYDLGK